VKQRLSWPGLPRPTAFASRFSQPLDAFIRSTSAGLVSCRIRSWGSPFRAFSSRAAWSPSPVLVPSCRSITPPNLSELRRRRERRSAAPPPFPMWKGPWNAPRLQGFAPHESPPLQADGLDRHERVALLGFPPSRVFPLGEMASVFTAPPLMRLAFRATNRPWAPLQGFSSARGWLVSRETADPPGVCCLLTTATFETDTDLESPPRAPG
jgi:hypothetical protein